MIEKVRIKKHQQPKIEQWCKALEVSESRFVEDAITFYLRHLEGKQQIINPNIATVPTSLSGRDYLDYPDTAPMIITEDPDDFDGGIEL